MSRKTRKNREVRIGIFMGKSARYNQAILATLHKADGGLTNWEIAKRLVPKKGLSEDTIILRTQKIYSVIQRKGGRLDELEEYGYIRNENGVYNISEKGTLAIMIKQPELLKDYNFRREVSGAVILFKERLRKDPSTVEAPFGITINGNKMRNSYIGFLNKMAVHKSNLEVIKVMVKETEDLLKQGIDLDLVNVDTLLALLSTRRLVRKILKKYV